MENPWEVLVVSSNLETRQDVAQVLFRLGADPICASSVEECRDIQSGKNIGLVFCDPWVKGGNYRDVLSAVTSTNGAPKVVMMSGLDGPDEYQHAKSLGLFDVIPSPCRPTDIEWMVIQARRASRKELLRSDDLRLYRTAKVGA